MSNNVGSIPLKNRQYEAFCLAMAQGNSNTDAYLSVYGANITRTQGKQRASKLLKKAEVSARLVFLQAENARMDGLSRAEKRQILAKIAKESEFPADKIRAIAEDNRMTGDYIVDKSAVLPNITINLGGKRGS